MASDETSLILMFFSLELAVAPYVQKVCQILIFRSKTSVQLVTLCTMLEHQVLGSK